MAQAVHRSGLKRGGALLALLLLTLGGCVVARETRQMPTEGVLLDAATGRPLAGGTLLVRADRGKGNRVAYRRYQADAQGRLVAPEIRGWTAIAGVPLRRNVVSEWGNEHTYLASGHAWLRLPIGARLRKRPPDRVFMHSLPADAPRVEFGKAAKRTWSGLDTWEIGLPPCKGRAQGLREGDGRVVYWDPRRIIMAATLEITEGGMRFEDSPRLDRVQVIENGKVRKPRRVFLDARTCAIALTEQIQERGE